MIIFVTELDEGHLIRYTHFVPHPSIKNAYRLPLRFKSPIPTSAQQ
jgi:hypothetical protein